MAVLTWMRVPGPVDRWKALAFAADDDGLTVGSVRLDVGEPTSWGFDALGGDASALGVPTLECRAPAPVDVHANRITRIDHVVYTVLDLDAAVTALNEALDDEPRRRFHPRGPDGPEMAFYRAGEAFIEVVASGRPRVLMGVAFMCPDLDETVAAVRNAGGVISDPKPAVQGGRIASVKREHGLAFPVAVMDRHE